MPLRPRKILDPRFLPWYLLIAAAFTASPPSAGGLALGVPVVVAGAGLRGWGAGHLVKTDRLAVSGPYAHLRHPLYAGTLLIALGFGLGLGGVLLWMALPALLLWFFALYFPRKERIESARLERRFGEPYRRYRAEVRALLPRWRSWRASPELAGEIAPRGSWRSELFLANNEQGTAAAVIAGIALLGARCWWSV
jgi:protein-S-isoprenylcysteine O-methyltransferase Ste14